MGSVVVLATKAEHMNGYYSVLKCEHNIGGYSAKYNNTIHVFTILFFSIELEREKKWLKSDNTDIFGTLKNVFSQINHSWLQISILCTKK